MSGCSNGRTKQPERGPSSGNLTDDQISAIAEDFEKAAFTYEHVAKIKSARRYAARPEPDLPTTRD